MFVVQDFYHKMIELSSEARMAYEVMLSNLEQTSAEEEPRTCAVAEKINISSEHAQPEEPEYSKFHTLADIHTPHPHCVREKSKFVFWFICCCFFYFFFPSLVKIWNKILEKDNRNKLVNLEEQLSFLHLERECTESTNDEES